MWWVSYFIEELRREKKHLVYPPYSWIYILSEFIIRNTVRYAQKSQLKHVLYRNTYLYRASETSGWKLGGC